MGFTEGRQHATTNITGKKRPRNPQRETVTRRKLRGQKARLEQDLLDQGVPVERVVVLAVIAMALIVLIENT